MSPTIANNRKPGDLTQQQLAGLPCKPVRQGAWERALRSKPCRLACQCRATMACGTEARASVVAGADLRLAEAAVGGKPSTTSTSDFKQLRHRSKVSASPLSVRGELR